jgi:N-acetylglucosaminyldiphosphoundecaprenol N-acetyl-beta-D-mannosaminyltransferase
MDLLDAATSGRPLRAHFCNVHSVVEASRDPALRNVYESAQMVAMDGMPLVWVARWRGSRRAERVSGPDVLLTLCDEGRSSGLRHFFIGGAPGVPDALAANLQARFPGIQVVGAISPPFHRLSDVEDDELVSTINAARPQVVWIGLGAPKQERWAADHQSRLNAPVLLPVGAAFNFFSGRVRRAPRWMQRAGLEWSFRLAMEPRRLLARYMSTNTRFILGLANEEIARLGSRRTDPNSRKRCLEVEDPGHE